MNGITAHDVVRREQIKMMDERQKLNQEKEELSQRLEEISVELAHLHIRSEIMSAYGEGNQFITYDQSGNIRQGHRDKILVQDALRKIFDEAGRPMHIQEIREGLAKFGFVWSSDKASYVYITQSGLVSHAGKRGYYQYRR